MLFITVLGIILSIVTIISLVSSTIERFNLLILDIESQISHVYDSPSQRAMPEDQDEKWIMYDKLTHIEFMLKHDFKYKVKTWLKIMLFHCILQKICIRVDGYKYAVGSVRNSLVEKIR